MVVWWRFFLAAVVICLICSSGCIGTEESGNETIVTENSTLGSFGSLTKESWMVHIMAESYHENPVFADLRGFMNETWYPNGPVIGWSGMGDRIILYVDAENPPSREEMSSIYQEWKKAAGMNGSVRFMNESLHMTDFSLVFEGVTFSPDDAGDPIRILLLSPQEDAVYWGDVTPHYIWVDVMILSEYGLQTAEVQSVFYGEDGADRIVSTPLQNHLATIPVPSITGKTHISVKAADVRGNTAEKRVNITVNSGMPFGPRG